MELLLLEADSLGALETALARAEGLEAAVRAAAQTADGLPAKVRKEFEASLTVLAARQSALHETVAQVHGTAAKVDSAVGKARSALGDVRRLVASLDRPIEQATEAAAAWQTCAAEVHALLGIIRELKEVSAGEEPPPDIEDYAELAGSVHAAAGELRMLLAEFQQPLVPGSGLHHVAMVTEATVDTLFWRAVALAGVVFALAVAYHMTRRLLRPVRRAGGSA
jgi:hypothetical protein